MMGPNEDAKKRIGTWSGAHAPEPDGVIYWTYSADPELAERLHSAGGETGEVDQVIEFNPAPKRGYPNNVHHEVTLPDEVWPRMPMVAIHGAPTLEIKRGLETIGIFARHVVITCRARIARERAEWRIEHVELEP